MNTTLTLVDLGGAIALLIWGVHMVQTGITRAFGPQLRRMLSYALGTRFKAFLAGLGVTSVAHCQRYNAVNLKPVRVAPVILAPCALLCEAEKIRAGQVMMMPDFGPAH